MLTGSETSTYIYVALRTHWVFAVITRWKTRIGSTIEVGFYDVIEPNKIKLKNPDSDRPFRQFLNLSAEYP